MKKKREMNGDKKSNKKKEKRIKTKTHKKMN
jgi:hypothetical protein